MAISTHILDISRGEPASGVEVLLTRQENGIYVPVAKGVSDVKGRIGELAPSAKGTYCLEFKVEDYFKRHELPVFFPKITIYFVATEASYHVPVLLSAFGFSTYRGC